MELKLNRIFFNDKYTIGKLFINGQLFCDTIEDTNRDLNKDCDLNDNGESKVYGETCIPFGTYKVIVNKSVRFKRLLPLLVDVKHFDGIRIHNGKDQHSSSGCIIVGENKIKGQVVNSTYYMNKLTDMLIEEQNKGIKSTIQIV